MQINESVVTSWVDRRKWICMGYVWMYCNKSCNISRKSSKSLKLKGMNKF